ncbi:hypothetical protein E4U11_003964 [Claviceps purpurea]|nr:hypothetical protein E4U11_003964 [Claviceps purpurea]
MMLKTWSDRKSHGREWTWDVDGRYMGRSMERVLKRRGKARYPSQGEKWLITRQMDRQSQQFSSLPSDVMATPKAKAPS